MLSPVVSAFASRSIRVFSLLILTLTSSVGALTACGGEPQLGPGDASAGRLLGIVVNEVRRTQEVRYSSPRSATAAADGLLLSVTNVQAGDSIPFRLGDDRTLYRLSPSRGGRQITIMFGTLYNNGDSDRTVTLDGASLRLNTSESPEVYTLLDVNPANVVNVQTSSETVPDNQVFPLFPGGEYTLKPEEALSRWLAFETPEGSVASGLSWRIGGQDAVLTFGSGHYLVAPSSPGNELVAINLQVFNRESNTVAMEIVGDAVELRGFGIDEAYTLLDVSPDNTVNVTSIPDSHPAENRFTPFVRGVVPDLPLGNSLVGWIIFEIPKGAGLRELKWDTGDTVFVRPN